MVEKYRTVTVTTGCWKPGEDCLLRIVDSIEDKIRDGDIVTVSEKAMSTALGNLVDCQAVLLFAHDAGDVPAVGRP